MGKLTSTGKRTVKVGDHPHTNMISKQAIVKRGKYKCRILGMHLKLRDQQLKTILCIYICYIFIYNLYIDLLYQNLMVTANTKQKLKKQANYNVFVEKYTRSLITKFY